MIDNSNAETPLHVGSDNFIVERLMNEVMIYDKKRNEAFCLNPKAAFVWQHCDGKTTVPELAILLQKELGEP